ncbi:MAG: AEC family transporter [Ruminococcus sp.]|nr:AEC family transporter [Ruminococcus sp.]
MFLSNFLIIGQQVLVLFILIAIGFLCGKGKMMTEHAAKVMTDIVLYVVTPCVMVAAFQREFSWETLGKVLIAAATAVVIMAVSVLVARLALRDRDIARKKVLQFAVIFSNCGFMSLPLQKELLGDDGWFFGSIFVAVFNIIVWTYGLVDMSGDKKQLSVKRLALNPGLVGALAAVLLFVFGVQLPPVILQPVTHLANLNTPVPMLIIGFYLSQTDFKKAFSDKGAYLGCLFRLVLIPLAAAFAMVALRLDRTMIIAYTIACAAPTAATTTMFATKFNRDVNLSVSVVATSTIFSLVTMPLIVSLIWMLA